MLRVQLLCLPYSGGSANLYLAWKKKLPPWIEVCPVELPGHGARIGSELETSMSRLVRRVAGDVLPSLRRPFALFGHSMGAVLAFELAHAVRTFRHGEEPLLLFASGTSAPSRRNDARYARIQSDADLLAELRSLRGTPEEVLGAPELMALILPVLRADLQICGNYRYVSRPRLRCPIQVLVGESDDTSLPGSVEAWREHTSGECSVERFPGGHFFIHSEEAAVLRLIERRLAELVLEHEPAGRRPSATKQGGF